MAFSKAFPDGFLWGGAANQLEGAWNVGGKGLSVSDVYTFDNDMPRERWLDQWLGMTHAQVREAQDPNSKNTTPNAKATASITTLKRISRCLPGWVLNASACRLPDAHLPAW